MIHIDRVVIIARGDVQRVRFRDIVQKIARDLGISGNVENQDKMLDNQKETVEEIRGVRSELHEYLDKRFTRLEGEIGKIKKAIEELDGSYI